MQKLKPKRRYGKGCIEGKDYLLGRWTALACWV
jgi:hypothetical protein